ncbi:S41 family peptidase [Candidatus Microgenomates bacterium]|nr:S41 family peptidase [Candidatus Microgenomates bacterium]
MEQKNNLTTVLLGVGIALALFGGGYKLGQMKGPSAANSIQASQINSGGQLKYFDGALFDEAVQTLNEKYVDRTKLDSKKEFYGSIKGLIASVGDPYTFFLTPEENKDAKDDLGGRFEGIGAQLGLKNNHIVVIAPLKNSPAEKAGIVSGDYITKVDGKSTKDWTLVQAVSKIRGTKGTSVSLTLTRGTKEFTVKIMRDQIHVDSVELSYQDNAAIIKVNQFSENTNDEWDKAVEDVSQKYDNKAIKGLVVDLRGNPGGFLDSAVYLSSEFLPGTLIGEKSFGKGSVQEALDLKGGAGLHVTVAKWILPGGEWINGKGIEPAVKVENKALEPDANNTPTAEELKASDLQMQKAIELATK